MTDEKITDLKERRDKQIISDITRALTLAYAQLSVKDLRDIHSTIIQRLEQSVNLV